MALSAGSAKISKVYSGSAGVKKIYVGPDLVWPDSLYKITGYKHDMTDAYSSLVSAVYSTKNSKLVMTDIFNNKIIIRELDGSKKSGVTYTDYAMDTPWSICEDNEGYFYVVQNGSSTVGLITKLKLTTTSTKCSLSVVTTKSGLNTLQYIKQISYNPARNALIVCGNSTSGSNACVYQISKNLATSYKLATYSLPTDGCAMDSFGTKLFVSNYNNRIGMFTFSSTTDTATKTSETTLSYPPGYSRVSSTSDSRGWIASPRGGYMYFIALRGGIYRYKNDGTFDKLMVDIGYNNSIGIRYDAYPTYDFTNDALVFVKGDGYVYLYYV